MTYKSELKEAGRIKMKGNSFETGTERGRWLEHRKKKIPVITLFWRKDV